MNKQIDPGFFADAILSADETDALIAVWALDELEQFADLDSVRLAQARSDGPGFLHA